MQVNSIVTQLHPLDRHQRICFQEIQMRKYESVSSFRYRLFNEKTEQKNRSVQEVCKTSGFLTLRKEKS